MLWNNYVMMQKKLLMKEKIISFFPTVALVKILLQFLH